MVGDVVADDAGDDAPVVAGAIDAVEVLQRALTMLGEQLARERDRGDVATAEAATLREQIAALQADLSAAQAAADRHHAEAQAHAQRLADIDRDMAERRARGLVARLRDAWRGGKNAG